MFRFKTKLFSTPSSLFKMAFIFVVSAVIATCGKKDDSSRSGGGPAPAPVQPTFGTGYVIQNGQEVLLSSVISNGPVHMPISVSWSFMANQLLVQRTEMFGVGTSVQKAYNGPIAVRGTMSIPATYALGNCQLPAGTYTIVPLRAGHWGPYGVINVPMFEAINGNVHLMFSFLNGVIVDPNADGVVDRIAGSLRLRKIRYGSQNINCFASSIYLN